MSLSFFPRSVCSFLFVSLLVPLSWAGDPDTVLNEAVLSQDAGRHAEAVRILERGVVDFPDNSLLRAELGWAHLNEGRFSEAAEALARVPSTSPADSRARLGEAVVALETGRLDAAEALLSRLVTDNPKSAITHIYLGDVLQKMGRVDMALESWRRAIKEDSHVVEVRLRLGHQLEESGRFDEAWTEFARINYTDPRNSEAQAGLRRLRSKITKKPEEIIPPRRIASHTPVPEAPSSARMLTIGIGSSGGGAPTGKKNVSFRLSHDFRIEDEKGNLLVTGQGGESWEIRLINAKVPVARIFDASGTARGDYKGTVVIRNSHPSGTIILNTLRFAPGMAWGGIADRELRGDMLVKLSTKPRRLVLINRVGLEEYVYGVLGAEMPVHWPLEALKCQAVIARTLAIFRSERIRMHRRHGYDLCDEQHCQVYAGIRVENDKARQAVDETRGIIVTHDGKAAHTVFSSNCGGITQSGTQVGWGAIAYWQSVLDTRPGTRVPQLMGLFRTWLQSRPDLYCAASQYVWNPEYRWARVVPARVIADRLLRKRRLGRVRQIYILKRSPTGHVQRVAIHGTKGSVTLSKEHEIRRYLGLGLLRSTQFTMETVVRDGKTRDFVFYGGGWGHGVGLCQSGSAGRAEDGQNFKDILLHYYPGTRVEYIRS